MAYQITPQQTRINDPFSQTLFQFNLPHSNLYLSNPLNSLFHIIGNDIITNGLDINSLSMSTSNIVSVTINPGTCIVDHVFHEILESVTLSLDVSTYDDQNGKLVVAVNYQFLQTPESNPLRFKLCYVSNDGNTVLPVNWEPGVDRVVLSILNFDKSTKSVTESTDSAVNILNKTYLVRGYNDNTKPNIHQFIFDTAETDFGYYD